MALNTASFGESKQRSAGSDLDVIRMGCKAYQCERAVRQAQMPHCNVEISIHHERAELQ
jgi:hypothetical protein